MNKLAVIVLLIGLAACSKKKEEEGREPAQTATPGPVVGSAAGAPTPATGGVATGNAATGGSAATGSAAPSIGTGVGCATATTLVCDAGQRDGCDGGVLSVHACVAKDAKAGPPCAQPPAMTCPDGQTDACLHDPPQANNHVCVIAAKPAP